MMKNLSFLFYSEIISVLYEIVNGALSAYKKKKKFAVIIKSIVRFVFANKVTILLSVLSQIKLLNENLYINNDILLVSWLFQSQMSLW